ncbi:ovochymase, putative [Ixodes scapularis]|uniref:Ovochymase, putative n=1 Tax=Ixodes scapularis TaxID=6945 RepID=B7PS16_IXOSC|nr:ovochymase, putative [Ixodes scapularis]|eukprot:XP_002401758.1 ovochymase, putative [Ixodes scapularis]
MVSLLWECGVRGGAQNTAGGISQIVGGNKAAPLEFPWQISLRILNLTANYEKGHTCGGSIINKQHVMTAAHCVYVQTINGLRTEGGVDTNPDLLKVDLPIVPYSECRRIYRRVNTVDRNTMICAGTTEGGKGTCQGDSGGPLQCQRSDGRYVLAGLTSWGTICAAPNQPTVFSRVSTQLLWIWLTAGATP